MNKKEQALEALEQVIKEREAADRRRKAMKGSQEEAIVSDWTLTQLHIVAIVKEQERANNTMLEASYYKSSKEIIGSANPGEDTTSR
ncbi:hypothetical protein P8825_23255 [Shouchella clausii]|uniref:hypothetical protein n=1 Tax=Shouchella clausii TaxID=79880 RepID=UPI002DBA1AA1|nr:hypothetical protein [Shouchella clausii]MEB5482459.1 hypothetical protein [Shouchella clausii]